MVNYYDYTEMQGQQNVKKKREKSVFIIGIWTQDSPARSRVAIPTAICRLPKCAAKDNRKIEKGLVGSARNRLVRSVAAERRLARSVATVCSPALESVSCAGAVGNSDSY